MTSSAVMMDVIGKEIESLQNLHQSMGLEFIDALNLIKNADKLVFTGIGKSGLVARRTASTFCSIGKPAVFLHPVEALHGDMGVLFTDDVIVPVSHSGNTHEVVQMLDHFAKFGGVFRVLAIVGDRDSEIAKRADVVIPTRVVEEADPDGFVPTSSCINTAAIGDALAIGFKVDAGYGPLEFAKLHPGGSLGGKLSDE